MAKKETSDLEYTEDTHDMVPIVEHTNPKGEKGRIAMKDASHHDIANAMAKLAREGHSSTLSYAAIRKPTYKGTGKSGVVTTQPKAKPAAAKKPVAKNPAAKPAPKAPAKAAPKKAGK